MFKSIHIALAIALTTAGMAGTAVANDELIDWMMEEEQQTLDASLQELDPLLTASEEETTALTTDLQTAEQELASTNTEISSTEASISELEAQIAALEEEQAAAETTDTTTDETTEPSIDYDAEIAALEAQLAEQEAQLTTLEADAATLTTTITLTAEELEAAIQEQAALLEEINLANETYNSELDLVTSQIGELSDNQIKSLLHYMNTTDSNGIDLQLDSEQLAIILDGDYSFQKTNLVLKAYTEEAKFLSKADALRAEAEATGNEELLKVADMMEQRAEDQLNRFSDLAAGHPGRSEQKVSDEEVKAAERKARGQSSAPAPSTQGTTTDSSDKAPKANKPASAGSTDRSTSAAPSGSQNKGSSAKGNSGNRGKSGS